ncbi:ATP-binding cassette domain-containing protein [Pelagibius litoralis]|uniref:ATP-binding cassette domain-containing protein n=1 Tax=Pelagibius litoralis TaxID=374515 RepID=A0A967F2E0_9PROT|nr:ATP-binding cassette domain-containing protein [Pelagibius litoralis]NIA71661.1 ATP-binding cassette domain-containing protein [Pelagibius litoralis]
MEPNIFRYVWHHSRAEQLVILVLVLLSLPFYYLSLNLPKQIVNEGIQGQGFDGPGATQRFFSLDLPFAESLFGRPIQLFEGLSLDQANMLLALSLSFLSLVLVNGLFKFVINTRKGRMGERLLRRLRYELSDRILRFPLPHLRRVKPSEMATMVKDEVEPLGGFIGDAFATPLFLGGQALTALTFILVQSIWLGLVAAAIVLFQAFLIPKLRKRILVLGRERQLTARMLAGRIGELIDGGVEVHANDTSNYERADLSSRLGRIFKIRYEIYQRKFFVKFLNNLLAQFTPFVFYLGGGLLAIYGHLDIGALVAVIAAYKDLPSPIKELIDWDQQRLDVQIKYEQVIDQFQPPSLIDPAQQLPDNDPGPPLTGQIAASSLTLLDENDIPLLRSVSFTAETTQHIAIVGQSGSGMEQLSLLLAGLIEPSSGHLWIAGKDIDELPSSVTGRRLSYVGQNAYHFTGSLRSNLLYGLKHKPVIKADPDHATSAADLAESRRAGNPVLDIQADWIDYQAAGAGDEKEMTERLMEVLAAVDLESDAYRFGLTGTIDPLGKPEIAAGILKARAAIVERLTSSGNEDLVVRFEADNYNLNASVAENLLFGTPRRADFESEALATNATVDLVLREAGLTEAFVSMGSTIAKTMVEIFADLPPGHPFFEQFSFISDDDLPEFRTIVTRVDNSGVEALDEAARQLLLGLPFKYVEARHRLGLVDDAMAVRLVDARRRLAERLERDCPGAVEFYGAEAYNAAASLQDNILFGRLAYGQAKAEETIGEALSEVLNDLGLHQTVIEVGLDYNVGIGGGRLSAAQRQKLAIGRALLKQPDILIVNEAASVLDRASQIRLIDNILEMRRGRGVVWTLQRPDLASRFETILVMGDGRLVEQGSYQDLTQSGTTFKNLVAAE